MKRIFILIAAVLLLDSCAMLSTKQVQMVNELSIRADSVTSAPAAIFRTLSEVRLERGLFYAASLSSVEARMAEVDALAEGVSDDRRSIKKADAYIDVMNSYLRVLRSLSNDERWRSVGRELRGIGTRVDSLIIFYNTLEPEVALPEGVSRSAGKTFGAIGEQVMKNHRAKVLRDVVTEGDTLLSECVDSLIEILRGDELGELIAHEEAGLKDNYRAYLMAASARSETVATEADRTFVELSLRMEEVRNIRNRCVSALRSLKKAHHRLAVNFEDVTEGREDIGEDLFTELLEFNQTALQLCKQIREL